MAEETGAGAAAEPLPAGWVVHRSQKYARDYFFNEVTGETQWVRPQAAPAPTAPAAQEEEREEGRKGRKRPRTEAHGAAQAEAQTETETETETRVAPKEEEQEKEQKEGGEKEEEEKEAGEGSVQAVKKKQRVPWMDKQHFFFRNLSIELRKQLRMDAVAAFSVTECDSADRTSDLLLQRWRASSGGGAVTILDGMACVGGNTISFARRFDRVIANELDAERFSMLRHNVRDVLKQENVEFCNDNVLELPQLAECDILFLDPEWGGPQYADMQNVRLTIGDVALEDFVAATVRAHARVHIVALKLPCNYDIPVLQSLATRLRMSYSKHDNLRRMMLIVLERVS